MEEDLPHTEAMPAAPSAGHERFLPGTVLGNRYRIVALSGRGGMGEVYRADDLKLGQPVALKFLSADLERDPDRLQRLMGEVRVARQVSHANVCRVYDVVEFEGLHFITMEYVDGEDLAALLRRIGRLPQEKALDLARQIGAGLSAAHVQGIVHRDLKPANIMLDGRGRARITDFGLAAAAETVRGNEATWGTPAYMAPEQLAGGIIGPRTDVYALGLVLFEMVTGRRPAGTPNSPTGSSGDESSRRPSSLVTNLDPAFDAVVLRCLEQDPLRRPDSAAGVLALLPGGDPLDAALRAGETPSPEMVAAAGEEGSLSAAKAFGLLGIVLFATAAAIFIGASASELDRVPMPLGPEALRERARDVVRQLGNDVPARSVEWWVDLDEGYTEWSLGQRHATSLGDARPSAIRFNYRQSPEPITPSSFIRPTQRDPVPTWTGESYVALDPQGGLLEFSRLDRQLAPSDSSHSGPMDWSSLLSFVGRDVHGLRPVTPLWTPDVPSDSRAAWLATDGGKSIRLEAASWKGRPVWFRTIAPWARAERDSRVVPRGYAGFAVFVAFAMAILLMFAVLARHNLRLGRSDARGALRAAIAVFVSFSLATTLITRWSFDPLQIWRWMVRQPYFPALMAWLVYLGVEPYFRRRWPHRFIAWTRLLEGRIVDPLVGREALLGLLAGAGVVLASCIPALLEHHHDVDFLLASLPLSRGTDFWATVIDALGDALMKGLGSFGLLLLLRVLLRRDALAWAGLVVVWSLANLPAWNISVVQWVGLAAAASCLVLAARIGLVAAIVATWSSNLLSGSTPLTLDFTRWYAWRTGVVATLLLAIAAWGFRAVLGRRKVFSAAMFEG